MKKPRYAWIGVGLFAIAAVPAAIFGLGKFQDARAQGFPPEPPAQGRKRAHNGTVFRASGPSPDGYPARAPKRPRRACHNASPGRFRLP